LLSADIPFRANQTGTGKTTPSVAKGDQRDQYTFISVAEEGKNPAV
jgi:hypothetical protein